MIEDIKVERSPQVLAMKDTSHCGIDIYRKDERKPDVRAQQERNRWRITGVPVQRQWTQR